MAATIALLLFLPAAALSLITFANQRSLERTPVKREPDRARFR